MDLLLQVNTADCPTRDRSLPEPVPLSLTRMCDLERVAALHNRGLSRPASGWARLSLLLVLLSCEAVQSLSSDLPPSSGLQAFLDFMDFLWTCVDFSGLVLAKLASVGSLPILPIGLWILVLASRSAVQPFWGIVEGVLKPMGAGAVGVLVNMAPLPPGSHAESERARARSLLSADRAVKKETRDNRAALWEEMAVSLDLLLTEKPADPDRICDYLVSYGRAMYAAGKSFQKYSETINAVSTARPLIKRQMTKAWDLAFAWLQDEPHSHQASVLLAMMSTALGLEEGSSTMGHGMVWHHASG